ncbi:MAG TPA: HYR domain-containing protein [Phycisphaerae bacterium]|nr:HYR domain-containing protein [Phycisphaerae bacterium]HRW55710.1 HYR domain-containing protein [Phycisphaerae bacterium]
MTTFHRNAGRSWNYVLTVVTIAFAASSAGAAQPRFELTDLRQYMNSEEFIPLSADGQIATHTNVGVDNDTWTFNPVIWSDCSGPVEVPDAGEGLNFIQMTAVSPNGKWFAGAGQYPTTPGGETFRMSQSGESTRLDIPDYFSDFLPLSISNSGASIIGMIGRLPYRWVNGAGFERIGLELPAGAYLRDASNDGAVWVGNAKVEHGNQAFRWTASTGMELLGAFNTNRPRSRAIVVSADGAVVAGDDEIYLPVTRGFRWTRETGSVSLYESPDLEDVRVVAISGDGAVIVGEYALSGRRTDAFVWTITEGFRSLTSILEGDTAALAILDEHYIQIENVSDDGNVVVGWALPRGESPRMWRLILDPSLLSTPPDADNDGVCDLADLCDGNDASGDIDNDGLCNDIDEINNNEAPTSPDNVAADDDSSDFDCPSNIVAIATSSSGAVVDYGMPTSDISSRSKSVFVSRDSGSLFPIGMTTVYVHDVDTGDEPTTDNLICSFTIEVLAQDTAPLTAPVNCFSLGLEAALVTPFAGFFLHRRRRLRRR